MNPRVPEIVRQASAGICRPDRLPVEDFDGGEILDRLDSAVMTARGLLAGRDAGLVPEPTGIPSAKLPRA